MKILSYENNDKVQQGTAIALGNFDGLHLGHKELIKNIISESKKRKLISSVLLFNNHTKSIIKSEVEPGILTSNSQKINILHSMGVELIYTLNFNEQIMELTPVEFVEKILIERLNINLVVVGFNYRFGYKAKGDVEYLKKLGKQFGFDVIIVDPVNYGDHIISSTYIRELLKIGDLKRANELLGRPYTIEGKVITGKKRGKKMGFPTANLELTDNYLIPKIGVYETRTIINNKKFQSVTNIGKNPTFNDINKLSIESHILDFHGNIYGHELLIEFHNYIREDIKFNTKEELAKQIKEDIKHINRLC